MLRQGLRVIGWPASPAGSPELIVRLLGSLAAAEVARGNSELAFRILDDAETRLTPENHGILLLQRGLLQILMGRMDAALESFNAAIPLLKRADEHEALGKALLNRAFHYQLAGNVERALKDLDQCELIGAAQTLPRLVAKTYHGRGACLLLIGDLPGALRAFAKAAEGYADHAEDMQVVLSVERARAMLAAGLYDDAATELDAALELFPGLGMNQEHAEAELTRAQVAFAAGDPDAARIWARRAEHRFRRRRNETWAAVAVLIRLRAEFALGLRPAAIAAKSAALAGTLHALRLDNDAESAALLAARAHVLSGHMEQADPQVPRRPGTHAVLETRLQWRLTRAELAAAAGDRGAVFRHARAGLAMLQDHRGRFGSVDLQTGSAALGGELARVGLVSALWTGNPAVIFGWLERSRAQAFRSRAVHPPADAATGELLAELRELARQVREGELSGNRLPEVRRRSAMLEREIRAKTWQVDGTGEHTAEVTLAKLIADLAATGTVLVSYFSERGGLRALVITNRRSQLVELGDLAVVSEAVARLRGDLDALCGRQLPGNIVTVIKASLRHQTAVLTEHLLAPLRTILGNADLIVVPTRALSAVPWGLLPDLHGRPVTVSPSASTWYTARHTDRPQVTPARTVLVAGPNLDHAEAEIAQLTAIYPRGTALCGESATVAGVRAALNGCRIAHFAAHGHHEHSSVLFSRLDLYDGPLLAYDLHQLAAAPEHVVLSSCDIGKTVVRSGDEILGFSATLLYSGTRTVISSVAKLADDTAVDVMAAYHRALDRNVPAPKALADALLRAPLVPLVCFGG